MKKILSVFLSAVVLMSSVTAMADGDEYLFQANYNFDELSDGELAQGQLGTYLKAYGQTEGSHDPISFSLNTDTDGNRYLGMTGSGFIQQITGYKPVITDDVGVFEMLCRVTKDVSSYNVRLNYTSTFSDGYQFSVNIPQDLRGGDWFNTKIIFTSEGNYMIMIGDEVVTPMTTTSETTIKGLFNTPLYFYRIRNAYSSGAKGRGLFIKNIYTYQIPRADIVNSVPKDGEDWAEIDGNLELEVSGTLDENTLSKITLSDKDGKSYAIENIEFSDGKLLIKTEELTENTEYFLNLKGVTDIYGIGIKTEKIEFMTKLVNPAPDKIEISGKTRVQIKEGTSEQYTARVLNVRGTTDETDQTVEWSLADDYTGVSINNGLLTVSKEAAAGEIIIIAAAGEITQQFRVYLDDVDVTDLIDVLDRSNEIIEQVSLEAYDEEKFIEVLNDITAGNSLVNREVRTQEEVDKACEKLENSVSDLIMSMYGLPIAKNVKLTGEAVEGIGYVCEGEIEADKNVTVAESRYEWYAGEGTSFEKKENTSSSYGFDSTDYGKTVYAKIIPRYEFYGFIIEGEAVQTETRNAPSLPEVSNVKITGSAYVGETLGVSYSFYHKAGFIDSGSKIQWIDASNGNIIYEGKSYKLASSDSGRTIKVSVTPITDKAPAVGKAVESNTVKVSSRTSNSNGGGGGGGTSTSSKGTSFAMTPTAVDTVKETVNSEPSEEKMCKFNDIQGHWAEKSIVSLFELGYISGVSETEFMPQKSVTRAELVTMLVRLMGIKAKDGGYFDDVSADSWYSEPMSAAYEHGIISGSEGMARPNSMVTREEMAKIVINVYECLTGKELTTGNSNISDYDEISDWAKEYVDKAFNAGLISGNDDRSFAPKDGTSRAQSAVVMERLLSTTRN